MLGITDPTIVDMMQHVEKNVEKEYRLGDLPDDDKKKARDVYAVLALTCKGASNPYVRSAESGNGFDAWKKLCRKYQVRSQVALLNRLRHPKFTSTDPRVNLSEWQKNARDYEAMTGDSVSDLTKKSIYVTMIAPESMRQHLQMNQSRLVTSEDVSDEIESFVDAQEEDEQASAGTVGAVQRAP